MVRRSWISRAIGSTKNKRRNTVAFQAKDNNSRVGLSESVRVYRVKVLRTFLKAGVPLGKVHVDQFRELLEENAFRLSDSSNLRDLIPFVRKQEQVSLQVEINGKLVSIIFASTTHVQCMRGIGNRTPIY